MFIYRVNIGIITNTITLPQERIPTYKLLNDYFKKPSFNIILNAKYPQGMNLRSILYKSAILYYERIIKITH